MTFGVFFFRTSRGWIYCCICTIPHVVSINVLFFLAFNIQLHLKGYMQSSSVLQKSRSTTATEVLLVPFSFQFHWYQLGTKVLILVTSLVSVVYIHTSNPVSLIRLTSCY